MNEDNAARVETDFMTAFLKSHVIPRNTVLRKAAVESWAILINEWTLDEQSKSVSHDTERLERLVERAWTAAIFALDSWDPRFSLQALRTLPHGMVAAACQLRKSDENVLFSVVQSMTSAALAGAGSAWQRSIEAARTTITLSGDELEALQDQAPTILGKCIGACNLLAHAQIWYRVAGKGKSVKVLLELISSEGLQRLEDWSGTGLLTLPSITFAPDELIDRAMQDYDRRRARFWQYYARAGFADISENIPDHEFRPFWHTGFRMPGEDCALVDIPRLNLIFSDLNRFLLVDKKWPLAIRFLGKYFPEQLQHKTNLTSEALEACLAALGSLVGWQTLCAYLKYVESSSSPTLLLDPPGKTDIANQVGHLFSLLHRGYLRERRINFRAHLVTELSRAGVADCENVAERFLQAFSGRPNPMGLPRAVLFMQVDDDTCVLDLAFWRDFLEALLAEISEGDGAIGNVRGDLFEKDVRKLLTDALCLRTEDLPFPPNAKIYKNGNDLGDVDFCFAVDDVLINLDMKSWQRTSAYFIGHYDVTSRRQASILKNLHKVENRGMALLEKLNEGGKRFSKCVNLLIVATPEYLSPYEGHLWFGAPVDFPKVVTPAELIEIVADKSRFQQLVGFAG